MEKFTAYMSFECEVWYKEKEARYFGYAEALGLLVDGKDAVECKINLVQAIEETIKTALLNTYGSPHHDGPREEPPAGISDATGFVDQEDSEPPRTEAPDPEAETSTMKQLSQIASTEHWLDSAPSSTELKENV